MGLQSAVLNKVACSNAMVQWACLVRPGMWSIIMERCLRLLSHTLQDDHIVLSTDAAVLRVWFLPDGVVRILCRFKERIEESANLQGSGHAVMETAWAETTDRLYAGERTRVTPEAIAIEDRKQSDGTETSGICLVGASMRVDVCPEPFALEIRDDQDRLLLSDVPRRSYLRDNNRRVRHYQRLFDGDRFYGFGERAGPLNKFRQFLIADCMDAYGFDPDRGDPLYKHIPFYIRQNPVQGVSVGIFYDSAWPAQFDMGRSFSAYWPRYTSFTADGGDIDIYCIGGPTPDRVVRRFTRLTGLPPMLPRQALGYMGSTMFYSELERDADKAVLGFVEKCKKHAIPVSGFHLSSGYTKGEDGKRYPFCWNRRAFPDPDALARAFVERKLKLSPNVKPGFLTTHPRYAEFAQKGFFLKRPDGTPQVDPYWGGLASLVDFSNPQARAAWKTCLREAFLDRGIGSIWNDNNEFESDDPDTRCCGEGHETSLGAIRPALANLMAKTAVEAMEESGAGRRPYVLSRAGYAGIQRYAQTWSGDNCSDWESLRGNIATMLGMSLSGVAHTGMDIGGFAKYRPEPELLVRWVQNGILYPRFCIHSCNWDNTATEPWMYPDALPAIATAIRLRQRLVPYLYSLAWRAHTAGEPIVFPLCYAYPHDEGVSENGIDFFCGPFLLNPSVVERGARSKTMRLPEGATFRCFYTRQRFANACELRLEAPLDQAPLLMRTGAIIPLDDSEGDDAAPRLRILVETSARCSFELYEDDGETLRYRNGEWRITKIDGVPEKQSYRLSFASRGKYVPKRQSFVVELINEQAPLWVEWNGVRLSRMLPHEDGALEKGCWRYMPPASAFEVRLDADVDSGELLCGFSRMVTVSST